MVVEIGEFGHQLRLYYKRLFPYKQFCSWLSYGNVQKGYFQKREFSFTLKGDVYLRYRSFENAEELEKEMMEKLPYKIDIGAVYNAKPKAKKTLQAGAFVPMERELVFDIDMTDYDDVRKCCSGAAICNLCWPLMTVAIKTIDQALRDDFGFEHILWVYSGRRGVHCWVCDERARKLTQEYRSAVADYLQMVKGGENQAVKVPLDHKNDHLHPMIQRAVAVSRKYFPQLMLTNQDILGDRESWKKVLSILQDSDLEERIDSVWSQKQATTRQRWAQLEKTIAKAKDSKPALKYKLEEIMLQYTYPRLDINVSKGMNHLLKSPFCIHPKTGRACVPIDPEEADDFDPLKVPTLEQLLSDIDAFEREEDGGDQPSQDYEKTHLAESIAIFQRFLDPMEKKAQAALKKKKEEEEEERMLNW